MKSFCLEDEEYLVLGPKECFTRSYTGLMPVRKDGEDILYGIYLMKRILFKIRKSEYKSPGRDVMVETLRTVTFSENSYGIAINTMYTSNVMAESR